MPYIVATKRPDALDAAHHRLGIATEHSTRVASRHAFATLEEARTEVTRLALSEGDALIAENYAELRQQYAAVGETGGSVGPLPDGTVIEVELVAFSRLYDMAGMTELATPAEVLAAYNAEHGGSS